jgi:hypothetical protein
MEFRFGQLVSGQNRSSGVQMRKLMAISATPQAAKNSQRAAAWLDCPSPRDARNDCREPSTESTFATLKGLM